MVASRFGRYPEGLNVPNRPEEPHEMADMTQKILFAASLAAALITAAPVRAADTVTTPASGSPEETAILDVMRKPMEGLFGKPIEFKVQAITVAKDYAYVLVHPQRSRPRGRGGSLAHVAVLQTACVVPRSRVAHKEGNDAACGSRRCGRGAAPRASRTAQIKLLHRRRAPFSL